MKINAKIAALAGAALLMGSVAFAANSYDGATDDYELPQGFTFYNEVSSDTVEMIGSYYNKTQAGKDETDRYQVEFAGIKEKIGITYNSEKFEFELAPAFMLKDNNQHWAKAKNKVGNDTTRSDFALNNDDLSFAWTNLDWHVRFTPFDIVDFNLHNDVRTPGGYLPIVDQWQSAANLQGEGIGIVFKPIDGLRIALEVPMGFGIKSSPNFLDAEYEDRNKDADDGEGSLKMSFGKSDSDYRFRFNAGVDYKLLEMITIGATVHNVLNRDARAYGLYANASISFIDFNLGYTYNGDATRVSFLDFADPVTVKIGGHHKAHLAVTAAFGDFTAQLETLFNIMKKQSAYDLYAGLKVGYGLLPGKFDLALAAGVAYDLGNGENGRLFYREQGGDNKNINEISGTRSKKGSYKNGEFKTAAPMVEIQPGITYKTGANTFGVKANLQYWLDGEGSYAASVPVSWKYEF